MSFLTYTDPYYRTAEAFDVDKYNEALSTSPQIEQCTEAEDPQPIHEPSLPESPLKHYVRDLREAFREKRREFFYSIFEEPQNDLADANIDSDTPMAPESPPGGIILTEISNRLSTDGTGFVDSDWELMIDRKNLRMWRRPSNKNAASAATNGAEKAAVGFYEYRGEFCRPSASMTAFKPKFICFFLSFF